MIALLLNWSASRAKSSLDELLRWTATAMWTSMWFIAIWRENFVCHVGDHPLVDVHGAFEAGLTPVWRYTPHWQRPEVPAHEIRGLDELVRLLT